jgi:lipopolysaccharide export system protein LptA
MQTKLVARDTKPAFNFRFSGMLGLMMMLALLNMTPARAEKADRDKPVNIEADSMTYDDTKQLNIFTGNVTLSKGTILLKADRLVLRQDPDGFQYGTATGNPATFRQKRDGVDQFITGEGLRIDYDGKTEIVNLRHKANMKRLQGERITDEVHGNIITYESRTEFFTVQSGGTQAATRDNPTGRVRVIIQPKTSDVQSPAPVGLEPSRQLGAGTR